MLSVASESFSAAWFFLLGACIGSFLNVVVYRIPAGRSLNGPSRCPNCDSAIKWYDNLPILGWLLLQGRCRNCDIDIAARYPRIEFLLGSVFLSVAVIDVALGLANWPGIQAPHYRGFAWHLFDPDPVYLFVFAGHAVLMAFLLAVALIEFDRHVIPFSIISFAAIALLVVVVVSPALPDGSERKLGDLFALVRDSDKPDLASVRIRAAGVMYGLLMGSLLGWAYERKAGNSGVTTTTTSTSLAGRTNIAVICSIVGGWLGVFAITVIFTMIATLSRLTESLGLAPGAEAQENDQDQLSSCFPRLPLGQLFLGTWIYLLAAGALATLSVFPMGWGRAMWMGVFTGAAAAVFFRRRVSLLQS